MGVTYMVLKVEGTDHGSHEEHDQAIRESGASRHWFPWTKPLVGSRDKTFESEGTTMFNYSFLARERTVFNHRHHFICACTSTIKYTNHKQDQRGSMS